MRHRRRLLTPLFTPSEHYSTPTPPSGQCHSLSDTHTDATVLVNTGQGVWKLCLPKRFVTGCCNAAPCILFLIITISLGPVYAAPVSPTVLSFTVGQRRCRQRLQWENSLAWHVFCCLFMHLLFAWQGVSDLLLRAGSSQVNFILEMKQHDNFTSRLY